ncbi:hypothetical protein NPIL_185041 [Nephila pilipes]|uniref:Uncharacterized protein n=1 Tax=Nephila pilipes TaxID=299642 RepID=A0A8X6Q645_NEPPI|nr:hypothetical protein NPIL_185041 [Nephila pilipes]
MPSDDLVDKSFPVWVRSKTIMWNNCRVRRVLKGIDARWEIRNLDRSHQKSNRNGGGVLVDSRAPSLGGNARFKCSGMLQSAAKTPIFTQVFDGFPPSWNGL